MDETTTQKRPTSHRWAIGIFGFMAIGLAVALLDSFRGLPGTSISRHLGFILYLTLGAFSLLALILGGRRRWGYYICSAALGIWCARGLYTVPLYFYHYITRGYTVSTPYYHVAQEDVSLVAILLMAGLEVIFLYLFARFAFGEPSRHFYGFGDVDKHDAS